MKPSEKVVSLRNKISSQLDVIINSDRCILVDVPYYSNIGDVLIWQGTLDFFKEKGLKCLNTSSFETFSYPHLSSDTIIFFNGGGNLGDLYTEHINLLKSIVKRYPKNRIIILPQTVYYESSKNQLLDFQQLQKHPDLYFCARDQFVYDMLTNYFGEKALLVPDMAYYISGDVIEKYRKETFKDKLIIKRNDCEIGASPSSDGDIRDWPTFEAKIVKSAYFNYHIGNFYKHSPKFLKKLSGKMWDIYTCYIFRPSLVRMGIEFISEYKTIETTRLHGCILSTILCKEILLLDNSYGKNKHFYETWLFDVDKIVLKGDFT